MSSVRPAAWKTADVAAFLDVSEPTVRQLVREGRLPAIHVGRVLRFAPSAVRRFLDPQAPDAEADGASVAPDEEADPC